MGSQQFMLLIQRPKIFRSSFYSIRARLSLHVQSRRNLKKAFGFPGACVIMLISAHSCLKKAQFELKPEISCLVKVDLIYLAAFNCWNSISLEIRNHKSNFTNGQLRNWERNGRCDDWQHCYINATNFNSQKFFFLFSLWKHCLTSAANSTICAEPHFISRTLFKVFFSVLLSDKERHIYIGHCIARCKLNVFCVGCTLRPTFGLMFASLPESLQDLQFHIDPDHPLHHFCKLMASGQIYI